MDNRGGRRRLSYANVMSTIAVFGVLGGGGAWAAGQIGSDDIAKDAIRSKHLSKKAVPFTGKGSFRSGAVTSPTDVPKTLLPLPRIGRLVTTCSFGGSGNTRVNLESPEKTLFIVKMLGFNDTGGPGFERQQASPDGSPQVISTGGATTFITAWFTIFPDGSKGRPLATGAMTAEHGCGKTTALAVTTER